MGEAGAGARKCAVFQNKAKCVVSCPPATAARQREGRREEGQLGYLGDRAEFINTYSHPRAARLGHQLHHPHRHSLQPALLETHSSNIISPGAA